MKGETHEQLVAEMKKRLLVEELAENIEDFEETVEDVFPVLLATVLLSVLLLLLFMVRLYLRWSSPNPSFNRADGKTVLITGATSGIGRAAAVELARRNARVLITGRDQGKVDAVARNIRKKTGNPYVNGHKLDLGNLRSIKEFAAEILEKEKYVHILINNGAYMGPMSKTDDGLERCFGVNYLSHFLLTRLLMDKMKKNAPSRVINVVCDAYKYGKLDLSDLALQNYSPYPAYSRSKFAQMLFNSEIHKRYFGSCVWTFAVNPGPTATELLRTYPGTMGALYRLVSRLMFKSPEAGAQSLVYLAVGDGLRDFAGKQFTNCQVVKTSQLIRANQELSQQLWNVSSELCGLPGDPPPPPPKPLAPVPSEDAEVKKDI